MQKQKQREARRKSKARQQQAQTKNNTNRVRDAGNGAKSPDRSCAQHSLFMVTERHAWLKTKDIVVMDFPPRLISASLALSFKSSVSLPVR
jgi:hypothetical protein